MKEDWHLISWLNFSLAGGLLVCSLCLCKQEEKITGVCGRQKNAPSKVCRSQSQQPVNTLHGKRDFEYLFSIKDLEMGRLPWFIQLSLI